MPLTSINLNVSNAQILTKCTKMTSSDK